MISIVVCSKDQHLFNDFVSNVKNTIGVDFEIIRVDNSSAKFGICEAYNIGAKNAKFSIICFVHEDVKFITTDWGINLASHFQSLTEIGVVGIAGSIYKTKMLSSWWQPDILGLEPKRANLIQRMKYSDKRDCHIYFNPLNEKKSLVASLDGVFLAVNAKVYKNTLFAQDILKGFHGYDLDFSLRVLENYPNYVVYDILIEHFSEGINDLEWFKQNYEVHKYHWSKLPVIINNSISKSQLRLSEKYYLDWITNLTLSLKYNRILKIAWLLNLAFRSRLFKPDKFFIDNVLKLVFSRTQNLFNSRH